MATYYVSGRKLWFDGSVMQESDDSFPIKSPFSTCNDEFTGIYEPEEGVKSHWVKGMFATEVIEHDNGEITFFVDEELTTKVCYIPAAATPQYTHAYTYWIGDTQVDKKDVDAKYMVLMQKRLDEEIAENQRENTLLMQKRVEKQNALEVMRAAYKECLKNM